MSYLLPVLVLPVLCLLAPVSPSPACPATLWSVSMRRTCHVISACPCQSLSCLSSVPFLLSPAPTCPATLWSVSMRRSCHVISACPCHSLSCLSCVPVRPQLWSVSMRRTCYVISAFPCQSLSCLSSVPLPLSLPLSYLSGHIVVCLNEAYMSCHFCLSLPVLVLPVLASPCPACPLSPCSCLSLCPTCPATLWSVSMRSPTRVRPQDSPPAQLS
jgi:hypothetical protein